MGIFRSTDPTTFDDVDQVVINEIPPPASISGVAANVAILVGRFERGPSETLVEVGSAGELFEAFGNSSTKTGSLELKNKKFGRLKILRAVASDAAKATLTLDDGGGSPVDIIKFDAKFVGAYGNNIKVKVEAGTTAGSKYTILDTNAGTIINQEVYDNIEVADIVPLTFSGSKLVDVTVLATSAEPDPVALTALASGTDGSEADTDYEAAIAVAEGEGSGNIMWADKQSATIKGYLELHVLNMPDKMVVIAPDTSAVDKAAAITEVASYRSDRIIYAFPYVKTLIGGVEVTQSPASWYASIVSQLPPQVDPATVTVAVQNLLAGITQLNVTLSRASYINLKEAGISSFEFDPDYGHKIKTGCTTSLAPGLTQVLRRRMADFLTNSIGVFLKSFQNQVNSRPNRDLVKGAILNFTKRLENEGILPAASDVKSGLPVLVDTESLNTDDLIAQGFFKILYKQRIFSSMRFIVLQAEIGESVVVKEGLE